MSKPPRLTPAEIDGAHASGQLVVEIHRRIAAWLKPGVTLVAIDNFVGKLYEEIGCKSCFLGYRGANGPPFPSHACLSVNECVVHGTAAYYTKPLTTGDVLKVDIGIYFGTGPDKWIGDAAWTYVFGAPTPEVRRLMTAGKESIRAGIAQLRPGVKYIEWAKAVQDCVEKKHNLHCILNWGGHGIGQWKGEKNRGLHLPPHLLNHRPVPADSWTERDWVWEPGNLIAVEPMIAVGTGETTQKKLNKWTYDWPVFSADGSLAVHYEHDVVVTDAGPLVLTDGLESINDVIV
jgi:methionyl aminopeptidase